MKNVVLLRVGLDAGSGGHQGPLFEDGSFEFMPIPDIHNVGSETYGNTTGRHGRALVEYFPVGMQKRMATVSMHVDPEFNTFTYGDPTAPKRVLRNLEPGDLLVFYAGLKGWDFDSAPALYMVGYFEVAKVGFAADFDTKALKRDFGHNFHIRYKALLESQKERLLLIKGTSSSRLFTKAHLLSEVGQDKRGRPLKVLSLEARKVFGDFGGLIGIQMSTPRFVAPPLVPGAAEFVRSLV